MLRTVNKTKKVINNIKFIIFKENKTYLYKSCKLSKFIKET